MDPWSTGIAAGFSVLGGVFGSKDKKRQLAEQRRLLGLATGTFDEALGHLEGDQANVLDMYDQANAVLQGIEPEVLEGFDESTRLDLWREIRRQQQEDSELQQRMASAGLDSTTVSAGMQRGQAYGQADRISQVSSNHAGQRASAIDSARSRVAGGMMAKGDVYNQFSARRSGLLQGKAGVYANTNVVGGNEGQGWGQMGAMLLQAGMGGATTNNYYEKKPGPQANEANDR